MPKLDREDMMEAVTEGVRQAFVEIGTGAGRFDIPHELLFDAVRQGTRDAIWKMITNATVAPCADFFETVKQGVSEAMSRLRLDE
jgi:hypothetical protein